MNQIESVAEKWPSQVSAKRHPFKDNQKEFWVYSEQGVFSSMLVSSTMKRRLSICFQRRNSLISVSPDQKLHVFFVHRMSQNNITNSNQLNEMRQAMDDKRLGNKQN